MVALSTHRCVRLSVLCERWSTDSVMQKRKLSTDHRCWNPRLPSPWTGPVREGEGDQSLVSCCWYRNSSSCTNTH